MAKKRKKGHHKTQNAAGNSRISVLSEESDTYNPFKDIKKMDVVEKVNKTEKVKKSALKQNDKIIEIDEDISFEDIFNQWENVGVVNTKKTRKNENEKSQNEDFGSILDQWEISQGLKPKYSKKVKDSKNRKASDYKPTKDFSQILNEFENGGIKEKKSQKKENNDKIVEKKEIVKNQEKLEPIEIEQNNKTLNSKSNVSWSSSSFKKINNEEKSTEEEKNYPKKKEYKKRKNDDSFKKENKKSVKVDSRWDFSNIYGSWETNHDDSKYIEEKKKSEKKENKGISISYLRSMSPEAEIDLHGVTSDIAALKVSEFLDKSRKNGLKKVSIITGKGLHSESGKSKIKDVVLDEIKYSNIVREAYHPKAVHGGSGVIWVIFKSISEKKIYF